MNITDEVTAKVSKEIAKTIENNKEIQFYYNAALSAYQWKDSRFVITANVWRNGEYKTIDLLIESFLNHIDKLSF